MESISLVNTIMLWSVVLFNLLLTLGLIRRATSKAPRPISGLDAGLSAPNFTAETLAGEHITLANYSGKRVAFLFVGTHCGPCREAIPQYESLRDKANEVETELVLVSIDNIESTEELVRDLNIKLPVIVAPRLQNPFADDYKIAGTPSYCMIDNQGKVHSSGYPKVNDGDWKLLTDLRRPTKRRRFLLAPQ